MSNVSQNGNGAQPQEEFRIPEFVINLVGRLQLENEVLRTQLQMLQQQQQAPIDAVSEVEFTERI